MRVLLQDLGYALRQLRKTPGFTATVLLTLMLGIGANLAIFTLVNAILLHNLPVTDPKTLVRIGDKDDCCVNGGWHDNGDYSLFSTDTYYMFKKNLPEFEELAAMESGYAWRPITVRRAGPNVVAKSESELQEFEKVAGDKGLYTYRCQEGERDALYASGEVEALFERLMKARLEEWVTLADERLAGTGVRCYMMGGNDDPPAVLEALEGGRIVRNPEGGPVQLDDDSEMISLGWSNPTPWNTPRECSEDELARRIEALMQQVKRPGTSVMNLHVPPYGSGLDDAPELNADLKVQSSLGQTRFKPVGSTAVRAAIERYQPLLGLHGHIHEAHASCKIGRTVCINPGSDYGEGVLHGVLAPLHKGKLRGYQMVSG